MKAKKYIIILIPIFFFSLPLWSLDSDKIKTNSEDFETSYNEDEIYDPLEAVNRAIFKFNNVADKIILEPVAKGYRKIPAPIQAGFGNFLNNLKMPLVVVNQLLQGQGGNAIETTGRFIINSTAGLLGLIDVAEKIGLEQKQEDFGQTLATWGIGDGFYIVLPIFGPSNLRDASGMLLTSITDPINAYAVTQEEGWIIPVKTAANAVNDRSEIIDEVNALRDNSMDYYAAVRSSYYQNRKAAILNDNDSTSMPLPLISIEFE